MEILLGQLFKGLKVLKVVPFIAILFVSLLFLIGFIVLYWREMALEHKKGHRT